MIPTGTASLLDIQNEFGDVAPIGLNEYYVGAGLVVSGQYTTIQGNPVFSGPISIADYRGVSKITSFTFNDVVASDLTGGYNLRNRALLAGWNGTSVLIATVTINAGVYVTGTLFEPAWSTGNPALPATSTITLINNGIIAGKGGTGANGGAVSGVSITAGGNGGAGATGFFANYAISVYNNGTIGGGGGGGGGGGAARNSLDAGKTYYAGSGGGGGGGRATGFGGVAGTTTGNDTNGVASNGVAGTLAAAGAGGARYVIGGVIGTGFGGAGGNLGVAGSPGTLPDLGYVSGGYSNPGAGGSAGSAILGGANIIWFVLGSRLGTIDNPGNTSNIVINTPNGLFWNHERFTFSPSDPSASLNFGSNGTTSISGSGSLISSAIPNWATPTTVGIGSSYWIRFTLSSTFGGGTDSGDAVGIWHSLSSARFRGVSRTSLGSSTRTFTVQIASDAAGSTIVSTGTLNLVADQDA
jgi:hypothetical protein